VSGNVFASCDCPNDAESFSLFMKRGGLLDAGVVDDAISWLLLVLLKQETSPALAVKRQNGAKLHEHCQDTIHSTSFDTQAPSS
jgi:hypothetical protein